MWETPEEYNPSVSAPTIGLVTLVLADTEYSYALPTGTKKFMLKNRTGRVTMQVAYTAGVVGTGGTGNYFIVPRRNVYSETYLDSDQSYTVYVAANIAATEVDVISWA